MNPKGKPWRFVFFLGICTLLLSFVPKAYAAVWPTIVSRHSVTIDAHETVDNVLVIGRGVVVSGSVPETLIVWQGNVHLAASARVGRLLDVGGVVNQAPGAKIGDLVTVSTASPVWNTVLLAAGLVMGLWIVRALLAAALLLIPVVISAFLGQRLPALETAKGQSFSRTGVMGFLVSMAVIGGAVVLAATVIGLPLSALLLLGYLGVGLLGWTSVSQWLGDIVGEAFFSSRTRGFRSFIGASGLVAFVNIPVVGSFLFVWWWCVGIGAMTGALLDRYKRRPGRGETP